MKTSVKQLIAFLEALPEDAEVETLVKVTHGTGYMEHDTVEAVPLTLVPEYPTMLGLEGLSSTNLEISDMRGNQFAAPEHKKVTVTFGGSL